MAENQIPPYRRIAADIRRRISDGELAPGDRIPSTRKIAKEWNVALATATRALSTLRQEGLVQAQSRVGTVVAQNGRRTASPQRERLTPAPEQELTRERITRAAVAIADAEGLTALSMRGVAARLGVAVMSTYRYVGSKDELVLLMTDAVYGEVAPPTGEQHGGGWRSRLESGTRRLWSLHRAHPWLAQLGPITRPLVLPNLMAYSESILSALDGHGLGPTAMFDVNVLLYGHVQGLAVHLEREAQAAASSGSSQDQWIAAQAPALAQIAASGRFPTFTGIMRTFEETGYDLRLDELFELGLTSLLDGVARLIETSSSD